MSKFSKEEKMSAVKRRPEEKESYASIAGSIGADRTTIAIHLYMILLKRLWHLIRMLIRCFTVTGAFSIPIPYFMKCLQNTE